MVWSLSKTNTLVALVFSPHWENKASLWCVNSALLGFSLLWSTGIGGCFLQPDSYLPAHHSSSLYLASSYSASNCLLWSLCHLFFSLFVFYISGPYTCHREGAGVDPCDLCTTIQTRDQKAAVCWFISGFIVRQQHRGFLCCTSHLCSGHFCW